MSEPKVGDFVRVVREYSHSKPLEDEVYGRLDEVDKGDVILIYRVLIMLSYDSGYYATCIGQRDWNYEVEVVDPDMIDAILMKAALLGKEVYDD